MPQLTPFGMKLKEAMAERGMRDSELAKKLGVKPPLISFLKYKTKKPRLETIRKIAKILNKPESFFDQRFVELENYKKEAQKKARKKAEDKKADGKQATAKKGQPTFQVYLVIEVDGQVIKKLALPTIGV